MARRSLRDRNADAIAHHAEPTPEPEAAAPAAAPPAPDEPRVTRATRAAPAKPAPAGQSAVERLGIYLTRTRFDDARSAYLADWTNGGEDDTFARWIASALDAHAARTARQRSDDNRITPHADHRTGETRSFKIPEATVSRVRAAIGDDQRAGRYPSLSGWSGEAIDVAIDAARHRNGGTLPPAPDRLPNKLVR